MTMHDRIAPPMAPLAARLARALAAGAAAVVAVSCSSAPTPTAPTPPTAGAPYMVALVVSGQDEFDRSGQTAQFTATASMSDGTQVNRTADALWQVDNEAVASVSAQGVVTARANGTAGVSALVLGIRGTKTVTVRNAVNRTPDPAAGQRIPLPDIRDVVFQLANERPDLMAQQCPQGIKYVPTPWIDYMVSRLRERDTRWGYNAKPTKSAADNGGQPVVAAGDEIAYHFGSGPDEGSTNVYLIDILEGHCGPTPRVTYRHFTGEEPGRWTGAGRF